MIFSKLEWLVDEVLAKISSLHFELISTIVKGLQDQHENAHQNRDSCISHFFIGALDNLDL